MTDADLEPPIFPLQNFEDLKKYFEEEISEVICVVEAIDPLVSGTFQALQSYRYEDIVWDKDASFAPCLQIQNQEMTVDLDQFHVIESTPSNLSPGLRSVRTHDAVYKPSQDNDIAVNA